MYRRLEKAVRRGQALRSWSVQPAAKPCWKEGFRIQMEPAEFLWDSHIQTDRSVMTDSRLEDVHICPRYLHVVPDWSSSVALVCYSRWCLGPWCTETRPSMLSTLSTCRSAPRQPPSRQKHDGQTLTRQPQPRKRWNCLTLISSDTFKSEQLLYIATFFLRYIIWRFPTNISRCFKMHLKSVFFFSTVAGRAPLLLCRCVNMRTCCFRVNAFMKWCCFNAYF